MENFIHAFRCYKMLKAEYGDYRLVWSSYANEWTTYPVKDELLSVNYFTFEIIKC